MRILIVEDEHRIAQSLKKGFEQERYAVDLAYTGPDGLDLALSEDYDVIILDRLLPGMDGIKVLREMRSNRIHTSVLLLTAKGQIQEKVEGLESGADDYMTKPFSFEELLARVRALTRRPKQTLANVLIVDDLQLDTDNFTVIRSKTPITLSSKEFALLQYLMRRSGKIVTKKQIMHNVWDYEADILPNTIEVYIRNLRQKIDTPFKNSQPLINTIRGFGYKLGK